MLKAGYGEIGYCDGEDEFRCCNVDGLGRLNLGLWVEWKATKV